MNTYLDFYENLLTEKQKSVMDMYYREDFSLSEIAQTCDISRSAVSDLLKRVTNTLEEYETKLQLIKKFEQRNAIYAKLQAMDNQEVASYLQSLQEIE